MIKRFKRQSDDPGSSGSLQDLSFLLIIFFIVIAGFNVNKGFLMNLPSKEKPRIVQKNELLKCSLTSNGEIILDGQTVSREELMEKVSAKLQKTPGLTFLLKISPDAKYQSVIDMIYDIRELNVENFSFKMEE